MNTLLLKKLVPCAVLTAGLIGAQQYPVPTQQYPPPQPSQQYPPQAPPPQGQYPQSSYPQQPYPVPQNYPQQPAYNQAPPLQTPQQLDQLVGPIALYPDGLLAQVLTASTYSEQIPDAAGWANQHAYISGEALANAIRADNLQFAPSIMALLPFPQVLSYMAQNMAFTSQLSNAVLAQRADVMDAVQRMRYQAYQYGYLRDPLFQQYERVNLVGPNMIEIVPVNPGFYYVPVYSPYVVYTRPRPRAFIGAAFTFGGGIRIGVAFAPWGWAAPGFGWREHSIIIDNRPWVRTWNTRVYEHPYQQPYHFAPGPRVEGHAYGREREEHRFREEHHER